MSDDEFLSGNPVRPTLCVRPVDRRRTVPTPTKRFGAGSPKSMRLATIRDHGFFVEGDASRASRDGTVPRTPRLGVGASP